MTRQDALAEAQRRWGESAYADEDVDEGVVWYDVGFRYPYPEIGRTLSESMGQGESWEAAFADADRSNTMAAMMRRAK